MKLEMIQKQFANEEEYFLFEEKSECKHGFYNGNLIKTSGQSIEHNHITGIIYILLKKLLKTTEYRVFIASAKVKTPVGNFFYPDVMVCHPNPKKHFTTEPILIVEVLSESTRKFDLVDKFIQYQKIHSLNYYLCIEPENLEVIFYIKNEEEEWFADTLIKGEDIITLPKLNLNITLQEIYYPA